MSSNPPFSPGSLLGSSSGSSNGQKPSQGSNDGSTDGIRAFAASSDLAETNAAISDVISQMEDQADAIDLLAVFFTEHFVEDAQELSKRLRGALSPRCMIGCSSGGVIGPGNSEKKQVHDSTGVDQGNVTGAAPGIAVIAMRLPGVEAIPIRIEADLFEALLDDDELIASRLEIDQDTRAIVTLADPFTTPLNEMLMVMNKSRGGGRITPVIGGLASAGTRFGSNRLLIDDEMTSEGLVAVVLSGPMVVDTVVSQGCRPIGKPMIITRGRGNVIEQLGGRQALAVLRETVEAMTPEQQKLLGQGMMLGIAMNEYKDTFGIGDFLVRGVLGVDPKTGAVGVADRIRVGQTVQFQVRDAQTAHEEMCHLLNKERQNPPGAALLFNCNGRGKKLFAEVDHERNLFQAALPTTAFAGFFAAGEIGPVGSNNYIHGHTLAMALFRNGGPPEISAD